MPRINLRQQFVDNPPLPTTTAKINYYDVQLSGFMLEVRVTGNATYYLRYRDKAGRHRQTRLGDTTTMSVNEARECASALKNKIMVGFSVQEHIQKAKQVPIFAEFVRNQYLPYAKNTKRSWEYDKAHIDDKMMRLWGTKLMTDFTPADLLKFQNALVEQNLKPGTVNRNMALVKHLFHLAERWEVIDRAPTKNIPPLPDHGARERFLTPQELQRLLGALEQCQSPIVPDIIRLLILTGARRSEATQLPWSEIDLEKGIWTLPAARNKSKKQKVTPISDTAINLLKARQGNNSVYVFPNPATGKPLISIHDTWHRIRVQAELPDLRLHDLRHHFSSTLINNGETTAVITTLANHLQHLTSHYQQYLIHLSNRLASLEQELGITSDSPQSPPEAADASSIDLDSLLQPMVDLGKELEAEARVGEGESKSELTPAEADLQRNPSDEAANGDGDVADVDVTKPSQPKPTIPADLSSRVAAAVDSLATLTQR